MAIMYFSVIRMMLNNLVIGAAIIILPSLSEVFTEIATPLPRTTSLDELLKYLNKEGDSIFDDTKSKLEGVGILKTTSTTPPTTTLLWRMGSNWALFVNLTVHELYGIRKEMWNHFNKTSPSDKDWKEEQEQYNKVAKEVYVVRYHDIDQLYCIHSEHEKRSRESRPNEPTVICSTVRNGFYEQFSCYGGRTCCGSVCCVEENIVFRYWYFWMFGGLLLLALSMTCYMKRKRMISKRESIRRDSERCHAVPAYQNPNSLTAFTAQGDAVQLPLISGTQPSDVRDVPVTIHFDSRPHSQQNSRRGSLTIDREILDAPPSYVEAVFYGVGVRTDTKTAEESIN